MSKNNDGESLFIYPFSKMGLTFSGENILEASYKINPETKVSTDIADAANIYTRGLELQRMAEQSYGKDVIDAKFDTIRQEMKTMETKLDGKLDLVLTKMELGFGNLNTRIEDMWKVLIGIVSLLVISIFITVYQNSTAKPAPPTQPITINTQAPPVQPHR